MSEMWDESLESTSVEGERVSKLSKWPKPHRCISILTFAGMVGPATDSLRLRPASEDAVGLLCPLKGTMLLYSMGLGMDDCD